AGVARDDLFITSKVSAEHLRYDDLLRACDDTLRDLKTDYLDLYLVHWPNADIPMEETFRAMARLCREGKIRHIGVSNFVTKRLGEALAISQEPIVVNQVEYHPYLNQMDLYEFCRQNDVLITAYSPFARGVLFEDRVLTAVANAHGVTVPQVIIRWLLQKDIVAIPRSRSERHLRTNLEVFDFELSDDEMDRIENIGVHQRVVQGARGEWER
ncbi:MAG TPA: aldo/keto reductase, partial [Chloroflexi bacterium]|nr:aldo/keto reductase [Chloroflexota bacterium]